MTMHDASRFSAEPNPDVIEPGLVDLARRLDDLGDADRARAAAGFDDRLMASVREAMQSPAAGPALRYIPAPPPARRVLTRWSRLPIAAAVALAATLGAAWLAERGPTTATSSHTELAALTLEQDLALWLEQPDVIGQRLDAGLAAISAEAARISGGSDDTTTGLESWLEEGSL